MTAGHASQVDLYSSAGAHVGYAIRSCDDEHILTFDREFGFVGLAERMQAAEAMIADHLSQGPRDWVADRLAALE